MGLLDPTQRAQFLTGKYRISHTYILSIPEDDAATAYGSRNIHLPPSINVVTDHGIMVREGYNSSVSEPGNLKFGEYRFQVSNLDGAFNPGATTWVHPTTSYLSEPHQCLITRFSSVWTTSFQLITGTLYKGKVDRVEYSGLTFGKPKSATFYCTPIGLDKLTEKTWGEDDIDEVDLTAIGSFSAPLPENN